MTTGDGDRTPFGSHETGFRHRRRGLEKPPRAATVGKVGETDTQGLVDMARLVVDGWVPNSIHCFAICYSALRATIGSTLAALRAGNQQAAIKAAWTHTATPMKDTGSNGLMLAI
jgi:hypothetical protein